MARQCQFVFAYGSLAASLASPPTRELRTEGFIADLPGYIRGWGVGMDNRRDVPGYKYYTDADGGRPAVYVAFLDLRSADTEGCAVNGVCLPVDQPRLEALDRRERNYIRTDVSQRLRVRDARVWAYLGSPQGRERLARGRRRDTAVIHADYLRAVQRAFANLGAAEYEACSDSLAPGDLPVRELTRHDLPR